MKQIIEDFYQAFTALDAEKMVAHYHDDITFEDPAFGELHGEHAKNMWRMLCKSQQNSVGLKSDAILPEFRVEVSEIAFDDEIGSARWDAYYTFSQTGRKVHNIIHATFRFQDGKIIDHRDRFDSWRWARQALGLKGLLFGWAPFFKKGLQTPEIIFLVELTFSNHRCTFQPHSKAVGHILFDRHVNLKMGIPS
jgi:ketosteroid isomerase-like protein